MRFVVAGNKRNAIDSRIPLLFTLPCLFRVVPGGHLSEFAYVIFTGEYVEHAVVVVGVVALLMQKDE